MFKATTPPQRELEIKDVNLAKILEDRNLIEPPEMLAIGRVEPLRVLVVFALLIGGTFFAALAYSSAIWLLDDRWIVGGYFALLTTITLLVVIVGAVVYQTLEWRGFHRRQAAIHSAYVEFTANLIPAPQTAVEAPEPEGHLNARHFRDAALFVLVRYLSENSEGTLFLGKTKSFRVGTISAAQADKLNRIVDDLGADNFATALLELIEKWPKIIAEKR